MRHPVATGRLRRRLTVAFVLVAAVAAGSLAAGSFFLVREARLRDSLRAAAREARADLRVAGTFPDPLDVGGLLRGIESTGLHAVLVQGTVVTPSSPEFDPPIPENLREVVAAGDLGFRRLRDDGHHELLVGGRVPGGTDELYLVFLEDRIHQELADLAVILVAGWAVVVLLSGLVGRTLARRTLEPVAQASQAARSMAEGLLDTRLPVGSRDEFGAWAASFNEMADALEGKIAALSEAQARERRFTSDVAHELRTPVTALVGEASLLREHLERMPPEAQRPAELLIADVSRLRRLVEELMEIARFDSGRESVRPEPFDLAALAAAIVRSRGWDGRVDLAGGPVEVTSDRRRAERVLANLIGNGLEHGSRAVRVTIGREGRGVFVEVADQGPGIPPESVPHLFDRFYKADPSRASGGSGLGLAIARENARLLGGDVEVWSEVGVGTRFTVRLPATPGPSEDGDGTAVAEPLRGGERAETTQEQAAVQFPDEGGDG